MEAAAQNGIPTAFVIKDDKVQWIGHPMYMDEPLAKIVAGTWNAADYKVEFEKETAMKRQQMTRRSAMVKARKTGDWDAIIKMMDEDIAAAPSRAKASMQANKFQVLLTDAKKPADAYKLGREVAAANNDNAMILNQMAWFVLDNEKVTDRDLSFAMDVATQAVAATKGEDGAIMDTMARACWESGDKAKAIEWQKKAISPPQRTRSRRRRPAPPSGGHRSRPRSGGAHRPRPAGRSSRSVARSELRSAPASDH